MVALGTRGRIRNCALYHLLYFRTRGPLIKAPLLLAHSSLAHRLIPQNPWSYLPSAMLQHGSLLFKPRLTSLKCRLLSNGLHISPALCPISTGGGARMQHLVDLSFPLDWAVADHFAAGSGGIDSHPRRARGRPGVALLPSEDEPHRRSRELSRRLTC